MIQIQCFQPENIVCCSQNKIKIIDFGAAKRLTPGQMVKQIQNG